MKKSMLLIFLLSTLFFTACGGEKEVEKELVVEDAPTYFPQLENRAEDEPVVLLKTTLGNIKIRLFPQYAPKAVENFLTHVKNDYYDGVIFHRVMQDFMIQGGDPTGTGTGGESIYGEPFENEHSNALFNIRGAVAMANRGLDTNTSQFYIVQNQTMTQELIDQMNEAKYPEIIIETYRKGGAPWLDNGYTVFGQVMDGMDVVDTIAQVTVNEKSKPLEDVVVLDIELLE